MRQSDSEFAACPIPYPTTIWRAFGIRAVDCDTLVARFDRGFWETTTMEIRLLGIDAVELHSPLGPEAKLFTQARIAGKWLLIETHMDTEKYGRLLGVVLYPTGTGTNMKDLATAIRAAGYEKVKG